MSSATGEPDERLCIGGGGGGTHSAQDLGTGLATQDPRMSWGEKRGERGGRKGSVWNAKGER